MDGGSTEASPNRFAVFAVLLALAILVDHVRIATLTSPLKTATVVAALAVMRWPSSVRLFLCLIVILSLNLYVQLPWINNLEMLTLLLGLTILMVLPVASYRARGLPAGRDWLTGFEPLLRLAMVGVYALTFWHKLNYDFLEPRTSCAVHMYESMRRQAWIPSRLMPPGLEIGPLLVFGTLAFEAAIPLLLAIGRTTRIGILVALAFHYVLGLARFYEFSAMSVALLFLFAPPAATTALRDWWRARDRRRLATFSLAVAAAVVALAGVQIMMAWNAARPLGRNLRFAGHLLLGYGWWLSAAPLAVFAHVLWRLPASARPPQPRFTPSHPLLLAGPLLVVLNGISPYVGCKTENSYAMFSNVRTEGGRTNHLLLTAPAAWADYQTRLVRIIQSSNQDLAEAAREGRPVPLFELRRLIHDESPARGDPIQLVYERDGVTFRVPPVSSDPALSQPPTYWERKLLSFREIHLQRSPCRH